MSCHRTRHVQPTRLVWYHLYCTTAGPMTLRRLMNIPDTVVEGFGMKLRISFRCPIFVSTFMFIFIYLFPYTTLFRSTRCFFQCDCPSVEELAFWVCFIIFLDTILDNSLRWHSGLLSFSPLYLVIARVMFNQHTLYDTTCIVPQPVRWLLDD